MSSPDCTLRGYPYFPTKSAAYSQNCYGAKPGKDDCNFFANQSLGFTEKLLPECPFPGNTCGLPNSSVLSKCESTKGCGGTRPPGFFVDNPGYPTYWHRGGSNSTLEHESLIGQDPALTLDTGFIDIKNIGINSRLTYQFRHTLTCAPLVSDGNFIKIETSTERPYGMWHTGYFYGKNSVIW